MPSPPKNTNVTFSNGSNPNTVEIGDQNNDSLLDQMLGVITDLFNTAKDNFNELLQCPGGQRRGWKILSGNSPVEFAPCGCYDDALWPLLLGVPAAAKAGATVASKMLVEKARKKWTKIALDKTMDLFESLEKEYLLVFKKMRSYRLLLKPPPLKQGYIRLYRGQGIKNKFDTNGGEYFVPSVDLTTPAVLDIDNPNFGSSPSGRYWSTDIEKADFDSRNYGTYNTNDSEVFYTDIPESDYLNSKLDGYGTVHNLKTLSGQKHPELIEGAKWRPGEGGWIFPEDAFMPLRRRNADGVIEIVSDVPNSVTDMDLNPGLFLQTGADTDTVFLDSSLNNTNFLDDITRESGLAATNKTIAYQGIKDKTQEAWRKQSRLREILNNQDASDDFLQKAVSDVEDAGENLEKEIDKFLVKHIEDPDNPYLSAFEKFKDKSFSGRKYIEEFLLWFTAFIAFIYQVMSLVSIVKDKSCIPLMEGGLSEFSNKPRMAEIRNQRIGAKASVWAELNPETCECSECPADWNFCDHSSITNLYLKETNSCIPPCCGDQEFKPITLISTCKCDCPPDKVWMPCKKSDCTQSDSLLTSVFNPSSPGKCVDPNPNPEKLEWDDETCEWKCKKANEAPAPNKFSVWINPLKTQIKPCAFNKPRLPPHCECSGEYENSTRISENLKNTFNIVPITELRIIE